MNRPHPVLPRILVIAVAAVLALAGCAGVPKMPGRKSPEPVTMQPIPNPPEGPARSAATPQPRQSTIRPDSAAPRPAPAPVRPQTKANPARAAQLRLSGLEQLNRGSIERAVALLRQASQLDPDNAVIQRDLERAVRISDAVRAKPR